MRQQEGSARLRDRYLHTNAQLVAAFNESPSVGLLPHGKSRARGAPGFDDFGIRPFVRTDPFEEVKDQWFYRIGHSHLLY
jgi:hypothetical protein